MTPEELEKKADALFHIVYDRVDRDGEMDAFVVEEAKKDIIAALREAEQRAWCAALERVAQDFSEQYPSGAAWDIYIVEVQAFLDSRHIHYPECQRAAGTGQT